MEEVIRCEKCDLEVPREYSNKLRDDRYTFYYCDACSWSCSMCLMLIIEVCKRFCVSCRSAVCDECVEDFPNKCLYCSGFLCTQCTQWRHVCDSCWASLQTQQICTAHTHCKDLAQCPICKTWYCAKISKCCYPKTIVFS